MDDDLIGIQKAVKKIEFALVSKDYKEVSSRLSEREISDAIANYSKNRKITLAPQSAYNKLEPIEMKFNPEKWIVDFDLWFNGEQSDLTVSLTVEKNGKGKYLAVLDNLHIL